MTQTANSIPVYLEIGQTRTFAAALDWPGWCRSGRDEPSALQVLCDYGPRYARVPKTARLSFRAPSTVSDLRVVERLPGTSTTDFGAPGQPPSRDAQPIGDAELERLQLVLRACWRTFDQVIKSATGQKLRLGPRGGGRDLTKIVQHVRDADLAYLTALGGKLKPGTMNDPDRALAQFRRTILETLVASAHGEIPARGPRGGARWTPPYFVRRMAWHELDHAWEIQDRAE